MFVDDIRVKGVKRLGNIKKFMLKLTVVFEMVNICSISFYHRLKVKRNQTKKTLKLLGSAYIVKILSKYYLDQAKL